MNRSFLKLVKQISVATGKAYDGPFADELAKHNFSSSYWINSEVLKRTHITVKPDQVDHGITLTGGVLYNAAQTTDPSKIESLSGRLIPKSALTGRALRIEGDIPIDGNGDNSWLTENQVRALELTLKPDAAPLTLNIDNRSTKMYRIQSIEEEEMLRKSLCIRHYSLASGIPYKGTALLTLIKDSFRKHFTSGIWLTKGRIEKIGTALKPNQQPTVLGGEQSIELYNIDQLQDKSQAEEIFEASMSYQIVGQSGKCFPRRISDQLNKICKKNPSFSRYWLSKTQAQQEGGILQGEMPFPVEDERGITYFYNVSQMKSNVMEKCIRAHRNAKKASLEAL